MTTTTIAAGEPPPLDDVPSLLERAARGDTRELVGAMCVEHLRTGGKRFRAELATSAAEALGVPRRHALGWAAAVEMLHNATLVHDDIQDGDTVRRGEPTVWARHGVAQAINAGDLMLMLPIARLVAGIPVGDDIRWRLSHALCRTAEEIVRGQGADLSLLARLDAEPRLDALDEVVRVAEQKTAALIALAVEGAALLARRSPADARHCASPFVQMGVVFQLVDDIIDGYGDKGRDARGNDLREGKVSILVAEHFAIAPEDRDTFMRILLTPRHMTSARDVAWALERMEQSGALAAAKQRVAAFSRDALADADPVLADLVRVGVRKATAPLATTTASASTVTP
jgi:geranylgeranyl diphosphate synthase type I